MTMTGLSESAVAGVIGGTLSSILATLHLVNAVETIVLSAVGAVVSFMVSLVLEWIRKKIRSR
jgi:uncharacterized membrane protein YgaE (UPF0421/DUF939 family)